MKKNISHAEGLAFFIRLEIAESYDESPGSIILRKLYDIMLANRESLFMNAYCREGREIIPQRETRYSTCKKRRNLASAVEDHSLQLDVVRSGEQEARNPRVVGDDKRYL